MGLIAADESDSVVLYSEGAMFFRFKKSGQRTYIQIVENKRVDGAVRQSVIANLGRADELAASGALASLLATGAKLTDQVLLINALDEDADGALSVSAKRIGGPLLFDKIWDRLGVADVLGDLLKDRAFEFAVERAVFVSTLHRIFASGSDRDCASWMEDYDIPGAEGLDLHHFYRAMAWLGEEMEEKSEDALAPRCVKDAIEEKLFDKRRDLFADLSAVFMDTTSLSFYGEGGETLGEHGYSKDYRPDLKQMILALIVDGAGRPICTEMWPGKALVGNSAYRRYLRKIGKAKDNRSFEIDAGKLAEEARFDGIFVLRTNAKVTPLQAVLRYRDLPPFPASPYPCMNGFAGTECADRTVTRPWRSGPSRVTGIGEAKPHRKAFPGGRQVQGKTRLVDRSAGQTAPGALRRQPTSRPIGV